MSWSANRVLDALPVRFLARFRKRYETDTAESEIVAPAMDRDAQHPLLRAVIIDDEVQAVSVTVMARFGDRSDLGGR